MHAHAPPRVSAPLPSHQRPAPNPFSFQALPRWDTPGKLPAPSQLSSITRPVAQTVAVCQASVTLHAQAIKSPRRTEDSDSEGMPRLTPEGPWPGILEEKRRPSFHLGLHQNQDNAETEYSALANPFSMRVQILNNFPTNSTLYRSAYRSQSVAMHRARCSCITSAAKSLDILRQNLQKAMNKEIDEIIQKYMEKFFKPGIENIKLNNGQNSVSEEHVHAVSRQILEEAKKMYISERPRSTTPVRDFPDNVSETGSSSGRIRIPSRRRRPSDSDSERSLPVKRKRKGRPPLNMSGRGTPSKTLKSHSPVRREGPKWETDRIKVDTLFVMGARANKALGLGATRGRLYIKHPDIFKYSGDQDDKQWLFDNHHMPATGGKAYMLMVEDIQELAKSDEYRDSPNLLLDEIIGFTVPEWMCEKMKIQMAAMRTDMPKPKVTSRSRSGTPDTRTPQGAGQVSRETHAKLPFSAFSSTASKQVLVEVKTEPSPSNTEEMELLSTGDNEEQNHVEMSPLNMGGGFDDVNSDLDTLDEAPFLAQ
ncbi:deoxynucleotidyltransferase terminal-interacting protein 1-like [Liolophura sinensis]|uniref:deoxynucleotidyltransferase terminal-interacting protein 1-like n=1 Tax=Liolophura sinensis TaxID=3198878 RepID=UPI003158F653